MKSGRKIVAFPARPAGPDKHEIAFLPEALEIVEAPPSPVGRMLSAMLIAIFCLALIWACVGQIDIVATAPGKIIPSGRTKVIQPYETGVVRAIHVHDGQSVKAGEVLIELDRTMNEAERHHLETDLAAARLEVARLQAVLSDGADPSADFHPPEGVSPKLIAMHQQLLTDQVAEHRAKLASIDRQMMQKQAERATVAVSIDKLETIIPVIKERVDIRKLLFDHQNGSKLTYLEHLQLLLEQQKELAIQQSRSREVDAGLAALSETRQQTIAEFRHKISGELVEAERKIADLTDDLTKAEQRTKLQSLSSPVDGVVQQLNVHTIGGVVTPAQQLLAVVPADSQLEIEANVSNRDIGFVHVGEDAEIKVDTFNFTRYGLLHGKVISVSHDAIIRDKPLDRFNERAEGAQTHSSEPKGQELVYAARVSLDKTQVQTENKLVNLSPGMAVTAEIRTGSRRIISYLLSPLLRYRQESLRER